MIDQREMVGLRRLERPGCRKSEKGCATAKTAFCDFPLFNHTSYSHQTQSKSARISKKLTVDLLALKVVLLNMVGIWIPE